ncbi:MAG: HemK2/MTQ2 family protein methyltransferase [Candidatus Ranarchaeia archaeon]
MGRKWYFDNMVFEVPPQVYIPSDDTELLASHLGYYLSKNDTVWDVGTGSGVQAILARQYTSKVVASDINPFAIQALKHNCHVNAIHPPVHGLIGAFDSPFHIKVRFSRILFNAPYLSSPRIEHQAGTNRDWLSLAWCGEDADGAIIPRFLQCLPLRLTKKGKALLIYSQHTSGDNEKIKEIARKHQLVVKEIETVSFLYEKIILAEISREI